MGSAGLADGLDINLGRMATFSTLPVEMKVREAESGSCAKAVIDKETVKVDIYVTTEVGKGEGEGVVGRGEVRNADCGALVR